MKTAGLILGGGVLIWLFSGDYLLLASGYGRALLTFLMLIIV